MPALREEIIGSGRREGVYEVENVGGNSSAAGAKRVENTLEYGDMAGDMEDSFLIVAVLLSRSVEELDEDRVVKQIGAYRELLHLIADEHRHVSRRNLG
ncbi:hypothetical protein V2J09_002418 [Rumex salicifolius]